jgi:hypothetical protein
MDWQKYHNIHEGQTGVIIGNGPSLRSVDRQLLYDHFTFGTNRCYLPGGYIPDYYCVVNNLLIEQFHKEIAAIGGPCREKFVKMQYANLIPGSRPIRSITPHVFSTNPADGLYEGYTVSYVCMQLAYWMGFSAILLVGCDHNYKQKGKPNERQKMEADDNNHFSKEYFKGAEWNLADTARMEEAYGFAREAYEKVGKRIINLTPNTKLQVFEREDIREWTNQH